MRLCGYAVHCPERVKNSDIFSGKQWLMRKAGLCSKKMMLLTGEYSTLAHFRTLAHLPLLSRPDQPPPSALSACSLAPTILHRRHSLSALSPQFFQPPTLSAIVRHESRFLRSLPLLHINSCTSDHPHHIQFNSYFSPGLNLLRTERL